MTVVDNKITYMLMNCGYGNVWRKNAMNSIKDAMQLQFNSSQSYTTHYLQVDTRTVSYAYMRMSTRHSSPYFVHYAAINCSSLKALASTLLLPRSWQPTKHESNRVVELRPF